MIRGTIADQLRAAGLVSDQEAGLANAELELSRSTARQPRTTPTCDLDEAGSIRELKALIKGRLVRNPTVTQEMVNAVHRFKDGEGGKKLVWFIYSVRDGLDALAGDRDRQQRFLDRAFRKSNPDLTLPE